MHKWGFFKPELASGIIGVCDIEIIFPVSSFAALTEMDVENLVRICATVICGLENMPYKIRGKPCPQSHSTACCTAIRAAPWHSKTQPLDVGFH